MVWALKWEEIHWTTQVVWKPFYKPAGLLKPYKILVWGSYATGPFGHFCRKLFSALLCALSLWLLCMTNNSASLSVSCALIVIEGKKADRASPVYFLASSESVRHSTLTKACTPSLPLPLGLSILTWLSCLNVELLILSYCNSWLID